MKISRRIVSPTLSLLASSIAVASLLSCSSESPDDSGDGVAGQGSSTSSAPSSSDSSGPVTSPMMTASGDAPLGGPSGTQPTTAPTMSPVGTNTQVPNPTPTQGEDPTPPDVTTPPMGTGGAGPDEPNNPPDPTPTDEPGDETDPPVADDTSEDPPVTPGVPDAPQCAAVIKGELTECADSAGDADPNFSFFTTSRKSLAALSGNPLGFGGNLGGLECADQICALIAECVSPGNAKTWRAFLSTAEVHAKDRIGNGPWYDILGTKIADDLTGLIGVERPTTADGTVNRNLPNEFGCEMLTPECDGATEDNHHVVTGSDVNGEYVAGRTCEDWTSVDATPGTGPAYGLAWERALFFEAEGNELPGGGGGFGGGGFGGGGGGGSFGVHWLYESDESGCAPGGNLDNNPPQGNNDGTIGSGGGYGAIYCFAVTE